MASIHIKKLRKMIEEVKLNREWLRNNTYVHIRSDGSYGLSFKKGRNK